MALLLVKNRLGGFDVVVHLEEEITDVGLGFPGVAVGEVLGVVVDELGVLLEGGGLGAGDGREGRRGAGGGDWREVGLLDDHGWVIIL